MPQLDGLSLLQEIRSDERLRHLPVIMLTGHDDIASIDRAYHIGANSFATKPVNWRQLSYQIRYVLRTSRLERLQDAAVTAANAAAQKVALLAPATERDVRDFLQTVVHRANSIEETLSVLDRAQWSEPLESIRSCATQALAECSGQVPSPRPTAPIATTSRSPSVDSDEATLTDRRSVDVVDLQLSARKCPGRLDEAAGWTSSLPSEAGNTITVFALALPVLVAAAGAAVDYSVAAASTRSKMQAVADSAALASARELQLARTDANRVTVIANNVVNSALQDVTTEVKVDFKAMTVQVAIEKQYDTLYPHIV